MLIFPAGIIIPNHLNFVLSKKEKQDFYIKIIWIIPRMTIIQEKKITISFISRWDLIKLLGVFFRLIVGKLNLWLYKMKIPENESTMLPTDTNSRTACIKVHNYRPVTFCSESAVQTNVSVHWCWFEPVIFFILSHLYV